MLGVLVVTGGLPVRPWPLVVLLVPALALDAVDGVVARRTGTSSAAGGRLDGEMDAALLLVLSVAAVPALGWWVLAIGLMRYAFYAAGLVRPRLRGHLAFSQFRRVVAAVQGIAFAVGLAPIVPIAQAQIVLAAALVLLSVSFGRDVIHLWRRQDLEHQGNRVAAS
jgi:phosphatidylglycerophosphate synthase